MWCYCLCFIICKIPLGLWNHPDHFVDWRKPIDQILLTQPPPTLCWSINSSIPKALEFQRIFRQVWTEKELSRILWDVYIAVFSHKENKTKTQQRFKENYARLLTCYFLDSTCYTDYRVICKWWFHPFCSDNTYFSSPKMMTYLAFFKVETLETGKQLNRRLVSGRTVWPALVTTKCTLPFLSPPVYNS